MSELVVRSTAFAKDQFIPSKYTCDGKGISPPLIVEGFPEKTKSFAVILEDPDAPAGLFTHWVAWNIPARSEIKEGTSEGSVGLNTSRRSGYHPPCPPSGAHRYVFKVYALDTMLSLGEFVEKEDLQNAMDGHILAQGELVGLYRRNR
jgi:Raf kinase inhibitor-like YbhB/YbcL family protein